jgi:hypothetical protein
LHRAARNGHRACVQLLLAHKAEVDDARDANARGAAKRGDTALKLAEDDGHRASASLLVHTVRGSRGCAGHELAAVRHTEHTTRLDGRTAVLRPATGAAQVQQGLQKRMHKMKSQRSLNLLRSHRKYVCMYVCMYKFMDSLNPAPCVLTLHHRLLLLLLLLPPPLPLLPLPF